VRRSPCQTPIVLDALPLIAAAVGTVQSTRICPAWSASFRLVSVSDWARNGTVRKTIGPLVTASAFSSPSTSASANTARTRSAASAARSALREPITICSPA